ncbi:hypothetical protein BIW11_03664 [Tropilaelaps mercedesae]|uniref:Uncharacterized protein n=1 Tax=Tropilaelaps mercedesae TaxID=418985 RepID=A0A1V9XHN3_9ACAR|nr:hypothetical protein BIW11_03664 [Tropilaelaps mercedesae]
MASTSRTTGANHVGGKRSAFVTAKVRTAIRTQTPPRQRAGRTQIRPKPTSTSTLWRTRQTTTPTRTTNPTPCLRWRRRRRPTAYACTTVLGSSLCVPTTSHWLHPCWVCHLRPDCPCILWRRWHFRCQDRTYQTCRAWASRALRVRPCHSNITL